MTNKINAFKAIVLLGLLILNALIDKTLQNHYQTHPMLFANHNIFKLKEILIGKVDVKVKDEAFNNGVKGLFIVTV